MRCNQCGRQWHTQRPAKKCPICGNTAVIALPGQSHAASDPAGGRLAKLLRYVNAAHTAERQFDLEKLLAHRVDVEIDPDGLRTVAEEAAQRLRAYLDSWLQCAPNAHRWIEMHPAFWNSICQTLTQSHLILVPTQQQGCLATWDWRGTPASYKQAAIRHIDKLFADFLHESHDRIGVCKGCGRYFEKTTKRTEYHDEICGRRSTSRSAKLQSHHLKRHSKFGRTVERIKEISKEQTASPDELRQQDYWKEQIVKKEQTVKEGSRITMRWLNEAIEDARQTAANPYASCEKCAAYRKRIQQMLGLKGA